MGGTLPPLPPSPDGLHPLLLLLGAGRGDAVHHVVALHHAAVCLCLTGFDDLPFVTWVIKLETVLVGTERGCQRGAGFLTLRPCSPGLRATRAPGLWGGPCR